MGIFISGGISPLILSPPPIPFAASGLCMFEPVYTDLSSFLQLFREQFESKLTVLIMKSLMILMSFL